MFQIVQYRLTHTIPWFQVLIGGIQDAQSQGACIAHIHWRFVASGKDASLKVVEDKPCMDLVPIENIRFHPAANWMDPLHTSPYLIHLIPMYVGDVKERMSQPDPKGRTWNTVSDATLQRFTDDANDSTRAARLGLSEDPTNARSRITNYDVVWIHRHIHRYRGTDYEWYTVASEVRLTEPEPLAHTVFHGRRPYEMGRAVLETHKALPSSVPMLVKGIQEDINDTRNQRSDNVKFVLNKRYLVKRGANVDLQSLVRNVPGGITQVNNVEGEVKELAWPDVTQSSYLEEDRSVGIFDELIGNFNPQQVAQQRTARESERTMLAVQTPSTMLTEYMMKTYVETFVLPVLRQLVMLEQHYETDQAVLAIAGDKAKVRQKYGIDQVTDQLLEAELTTNVNVGMGATDPVMKLQRFLLGINNLQRFAVKPPPGININEVYKEVFALSGYQDGTRFLLSQDPAKTQLQQQLVQAVQLIKKLQMQQNNRHESNLVRLQSTRESNLSRERIAAMKTGADTLKQGRNHRQERVLALAGHMMDLDRAQQQPDAMAQPPAASPQQPITLENSNAA
jgi:FtsZ-binding cell division protein ZapB